MKKSTLAACFSLPSVCLAASLTVEAVNPLQLARPSQTLELSAADLAPLEIDDLATVHVKDSTGAELLCQAIDNDGDPFRKSDAVIFQADFSAGETKTFTVTKGAKQVFKKEQFKAYGRFNRERFDDFAWENDRIAHRTYGKALETWKGEPLTSSTIDIWSKRTPRMVVNDWYMSGDYHADHGEGADYYSAGPTRGCGGSGLWAADRLWVSGNFVNSNMLANGPIRVMFELEYEPYGAAGTIVSEIKRVTLDAGHQFDRYQSRYQSRDRKLFRPGIPAASAVAIGLKKVPGEKLEVASENGWLAKWEPMEKNAGHQGLAMIVPAKDSVKRTEDALNHLLVTGTGPDSTATWWAGFCWDKAEMFTSAEAWTRHVDEFARGLAAPIRIKVTPAN